MLGQEQFQIFEKEPNLMVIRPAGTGKTLVAMELPKKLSKNNKVLVVSNTKALAILSKKIT